MVFQTGLSRFSYILSLFFILISSNTAHGDLASEVQFEEDLNNTPCITSSVSSSDGKFIYYGGFCSNSIEVYSRNSQGLITKKQSLKYNENTGDGLIPESRLILSNNEKLLFAMGHTGSLSNPDNRYRRTIFAYTRNATTGALQLTDSYDFPSNQLVDLVISDDDNTLYISTYSGILTLSVADNGVLSHINTQSDLRLSSGDTLTSEVGNLTLSPDAKTLYATGNQTDEITLLQFDISNRTPVLTHDYAEFSFNQVTAEAFTNLTITQDNQYILAIGGGNDDSLWVFNANNGQTLTVSHATKTPIDLNHADKFYCLDGFALSDNQKLLYAVDSCATTLYSWYLDSNAGTLEALNYISEDSAEISIDVFGEADYVELSHDNQFLHISNIYGPAVFDISVDTGLTITANTATTLPDTLLPMTVVLNNHTDVTANKVIVTLTVSDNASIENIMPTPDVVCSAESSAIYICEAKTLEGMAQQTINFDVLTSQTGSVTLHAESDQTQVDSSLNNNYAVTSFTVTAETTSVTTPPTESPSAKESSGGAIHLFLMGLLSLLLFRSTLILNKD